MLLSSISSSAMSSSAVSSNVLSSTKISMITSPGLPQYGALVIVGLIILLSLKEVISASKVWDKYLNNSFNVAIVPLLFTFVAVVFFKVEQII